MPPARRCHTCHTRLPDADAARYLCRSCETTTRDHLEQLPRLYVELADHLEPSRTAGEYVRGSVRVEAPLPAHPEVLTLRAAGGIATVLTTWEAEWRGIRHDRPRWLRPVPTETRVTLAANYLAAYLTWAAHQHPAAGEFAVDVRQLWRSATAVAEPAERPSAAPEPVGRCPRVIDGRPCRGHLALPPGADMIWCDRCHSAWGKPHWLQLRRAQAAAA
ncbi:hypothetical protein AB0O31_03245 [Kitasatospora cineracea]|uniref:hypothetical protein n=1 Tax=Kitasatospora cineracea TaxID=88074 RepID=UPI0034161D29